MSQTKVQLVEGLNINTAAPATALQIDSSGNINLDSNTLYVNATNNRVGIGTTSVNDLVHVRGGTTPIVRIDHTTTSSYSGLHLYEDSTQQAAINALGSTSGATGGAHALQIWNFQNAPTVFATNNTERMRIDSSGRLLVGTSSAATNIKIAGTDPQSTTPNHQFVDANTNYSGLSVTKYNTYGYAPTISLNLSNAGSVGTNGLINNGNVAGIISFNANDGTNFLPCAEISGRIDGTPGTNDMPGRLMFSTTADGASSPSERVRIRQNGRMIVGNGFDTNYVTQITAVSYSNTGTYVGIGPTADLPDNNIYSRHSADTTYTHINFVNVNGSRGSITTNASSTTYNTTSDYRLKENVVPLTGATDRVNQLQVHRFNFIVDPDHTVDGFLAHEAQAVVPECVTGTKDEVDADGNPVYQGIDQSKLVPLLTAALQEAISRIETLEAEVTALKSA